MNISIYIYLYRIDNTYAYDLRIAARVALLLMLLTARQALFLLEQPSSSKLELLPYIQHTFKMIAELLPVHRVFLSGTERVYMFFFASFSQSAMFENNPID